MCQDKANCWVIGDGYCGEGAGIFGHAVFAPGAKPLHEALTPWQLEFQKLIGTENAKLFDEKSRLYFTKEIYDLLSDIERDLK